jgi:hypothetical protein
MLSLPLDREKNYEHFDTKHSFFLKLELRHSGIRAIIPNVSDIVKVNYYTHWKNLIQTKHFCEGRMKEANISWCLLWHSDDNTLLMVEQHLNNYKMYFIRKCISTLQIDTTKTLCEKMFFFSFALAFWFFVNLGHLNKVLLCQKKSFNCRLNLTKYFQTALGFTSAKY